MRAVVQRVSRAAVSVAGEEIGRINTGLLVFLGVAANDTMKDVDFLASKIVGLRCFMDESSKFNLSVRDVNGGILVISQFTLLGDCRRGKRPSFSEAAPPEKAESLYNAFLDALREKGVPVASGRFRAHMEIDSCNDGPVTLLLDSEKRF